MTQLPISTVRTSDVLAQTRLVRQVNGDNIALERLYDQLSTGRRVNTLSDDPAAAITAVSIQAAQEHSTQLLRNSQSGEGYLNVSDTVVADIDNLLIEARGTVIHAAQTPLSEAERDAQAEIIERAIDRIVAASNQSYRGHFVLGGAIDQEQPLTVQGQAIVWSGEPAVQSTRISRDWVLETGINAQETLGVGTEITNSNPLDVRLHRDTRLSDVLGGDGVTPGVIRLSEGGGWTDLDLRGAKTIGDLEDAFEALSLGGRDLDFTINPNTVTITYADGLGGVLALEDVGDSKTAGFLGIENPGGLSAPPINSFDLRPALTSDALLSNLNGGAGVNVSAGFTITQGAEAFDIDLSTAANVEDVIIAINRSGADVRAKLTADDRIAIEALASGVDYGIAENGGTVATDLGIRTATESVLLTDLNRGIGVDTITGADFSITRTNGSILSIDLDGATTIADVLQRINTDPANVGASAVTASLRTDGNGIQLTSSSGASDLTVRSATGSNAAESLGLIPSGQDQATATVSGGVSTIAGSDYLPIEPTSTIDTLIRLQRAIENGDVIEISRLSPALDEHLSRASLIRSEVGVRTQNLQAVRQQTEDFNVELASQLSNQLDADFAEVVTELTARQLAMEASLRAIAQISQLSVLNFL